jgi:hypothetical protein
MADSLAELIAERERRSGRVTGGVRSVLEQPEVTTTLEEVKRATTSLLKGSTKGIIDLVGGWGNLYDYIKENKDPSALSSRGIVNAIAQLGGPDLMKLQGYKGMYDIGLPSKKSIFELHVDKVRKIRELVVQEYKLDKKPSLPIYIMTSDLNDTLIRKYFKLQNGFSSKHFSKSVFLIRFSTN